MKERLKEEQERISDLLKETKKLFHAAREKGASSWLSALPIQRLRYKINKEEFKDAFCLRYGWRIQDMPKFCACGQANSLDHVLICKKRGYVSMRHYILRGTEAKLLQEFCQIRKTKPELLPTTNEIARGNITDKARLDILSVGVCSRCQKTFLDVRVIHPTADSHMAKSLDDLYKENEKKRAYNDRVINMEK